MSEWLSDTIVKADDGQVYEKIGDDSYQLFSGELPDNSPTGGEVVAGLGAEVGISAAGQALGAAIPPLYPLLAFSSGMLGNYTAQQIEGREELSLGRMLTAGAINVIPFGSAAKGVNAGTKITGKVVGEAAKIEAKRGAAIGAGESVAVSIIDEGELPEPTQILLNSTIGAGFGGTLGAVAPKFVKAFSKTSGMTIKEIDEAVATGGIGAEDLKDLGVTNSDVEARQIIQQIIDTTEDKQVAKTLAQAMDDKQSWLEKAKEIFVPSKVLGREVDDLSFYGQKEIQATQELGARIGVRVDAAVKKDPDLEREINQFLDNGLMPDKVKGTALEGDLLTYKQELNKMAGMLVDQIETHKFSNLSKKGQKQLLKTIQESRDPSNPNYVSREYELFVNPDFKPSPKLKAAAINEVAKTILLKNPKMKIDKVRKKAEKHIDGLVQNSAKNRKLTNNESRTGSTDSIVRARKNPGVAERAFLGEVTTASERIRGTLDNVGRTVYKNKTDINIAAALEKAGLATVNKLDDGSFTPLSLKGNLDTKLFVPNTVQYALDKTYLQGANDKGSDVLRGVLDLYNSSIGISKAVKVVLNPPSYAVNAIGGWATLLGSGINPNPLSKNYRAGFKYAVSEYGSIDGFLGGKTPEARMAWTEAMQDMTKYGISNANIIASDIRDNIQGGVFSGPAQKLFDPVGKAYSATDTAARFTMWASNQERISKMFNGLSREEIKMAAAKLTNDTFQNYDKLNPTLKLGSRYGVLPQFVSFTAEFMRNIYNQTKYAGQMAGGTFGKSIGIESSSINKEVMQAEGVKRLVALAAMVGGTEAMRQGYNAQQGIDEEKEVALRETIVADFDKSKSLLFTTDEETGDISYINLSYLSPHAMMAEAMNAANSDRPLESLGGVVVDNFVGTGSFVSQSLYQSLSNTDAHGRAITGEVGQLNRVKDKLNHFVSSAFKPGVGREIDNLLDTINSDDPKRTPKELIARQAGYRSNKLDLDTNAFFKIRDRVTSATSAASSHKNLIKRKNPTPQQAASSYETANRIRKENLEVVGRHYKNLLTLGKSEDEALGILRGSGVSSKDAIAITEGMYLPLPKSIDNTLEEEFDERFAGKTQEETLVAIRKLAVEDRPLAKKLLGKLKSNKKVARQNLTGKEKLIKGMSINDRASYVMANPDKYRELVSKGIVTKSVAVLLKQKGFQLNRSK